MSLPQYVRCLEGHVYDKNQHESCPKCLNVVRRQEEATTIPNDDSSDETSDASSEALRLKNRDSEQRKWRMIYAVAAILGTTLALGGVALWIVFQSPAIATRADSNVEGRNRSEKSDEESSEPLKQDLHTSADPKKTPVIVEQEPPSAKTDAKQANPEKPDPPNGKTHPDAAAALTFKPLFPEAEKSKLANEASSGETTETPKRFQDMHRAVAELRRVRLLPIPEGFRGWVNQPPKLPLPGSVSKSHSPLVFAELEKNRFALAMHWFLQGAANVDRTVRIGCWENAAYLGHPYAMWALSKSYSSDRVRQRAWGELAAERGVPHVRAHFDHGSGPFLPLEEILGRLDKSSAERRDEKTYQEFVALVPKICDIRLAYRIYDEEIRKWVRESLNSGAASIQDREVWQEVNRLHELLLEEFELRGAYPPNFANGSPLEREAYQPGVEVFPPGVVGPLVHLHRAATQACSTLTSKMHFERVLQAMPADQANTYRQSLSSVAPKLLAGSAAQVVLQLEQQKQLLPAAGVWRKAVPPIEDWAARQGSPKAVELTHRCEIGPEAGGVMQYLMARAADRQKRFDDAAALYEASYIHGLHVASLNYCELLEQMATDSKANADLQAAADAWSKVAIEMRVLGTSFRRMSAALNDGKTTEAELRSLLNESLRRGERQGNAFLTFLRKEDPASKAVRDNLGLTDEAIQQFDLPTRALVNRLGNVRPTSIDRAGNERRKKDRDTLIERALDQEPWALLALGEDSLPDPELLLDFREQLAMLIQAGRRGNLLAFGVAGRHAMHFESRLELPPGDKCIYVFAGWLLADDISPVDKEISGILNFVLKESLNRLDPDARQAMRTWMEELATVFEKKLPENSSTK